MAIRGSSKNEPNYYFVSYQGWGFLILCGGKTQIILHPADNDVLLNSTTVKQNKKKIINWYALIITNILEDE